MTDKELMSTDLMVGDWVNVTHEDETFQGRVASIDGDTEDVKVSLYSAPYGWEDGDDFDKIEPIHLTPEILEKNGFVRGELNISSQYNLTVGKSTIGVTLKDTPDRECAISAWNYEGKLLCNLESTSRDNCQWYVHQLQRVLKLCNIDKNIVL